MKEIFINNLPFYTYYNELEMGNFLSKLGILNQDERLIFSHICNIASKANSTTIDVEELLLEVIKWAERHNYAALRLSQTTKKTIQNFCLSLSKTYMCHTRAENAEIIAFTLTEPQFEQVNSIYKQIENNPEIPFPDERQLILPLQTEMAIDVLSDKINGQFIEENIGKDKIIKIEFPELNSHILITPRMLVQLPTACIKKIGKFFSVTGRIRVLDSILKSIEIIMPEKDIKLERTLKVLALEDKESPLFYIHLTEGILSKLRKETKVAENIPIIQCAIILKQFKIEQEAKEKEDKKVELAREDLKKILNFFKENPKPHYIQELYHLREEVGRSEKFSGSYERHEFIELVDKFIEIYTVGDENAETLDDRIPQIIRIADNDLREIFIHREFLVSFIERERLKAKTDITSSLLQKWTVALTHYTELAEMRRDDSLEAEVVKIIDQKYKVLKILSNDPLLIFNIFQIYEEDKIMKSRRGYYFLSKDKPNLLPFYAILEVKRAEIYREAYMSLPFMYRFFITRLILYFMALIRKNKNAKIEAAKEQAAKSAGRMSSDQERDSSDGVKVVHAKVKKYLPEIEKQYRSSGNIQDALNDLVNKWNNKVGEVRDILQEKIDDDARERSNAIYKMMFKSPNFSEESLHEELKNMAMDLAQNKYTDVPDKKSLARYIILIAIWNLRQKSR